MQDHQGGAAVDTFDGSAAISASRPDGDAVAAGGRPKIGVERVRTASLIAAVSDIATVIVTGMIAKVIYINHVLQSEQGSEFYLLVTLAMAAIVYVFFAQLDLYELDVLATRSPVHGKLVGGVFLAVLTVLGLLFLLKVSDYFSRAWFVLWFVGSVAGLFVTRSMVRNWLRQRLQEGRFRNRVAIYGTADYAQRLNALVQSTSPTSAVDCVHLRADHLSEGEDSGLADLRQALQNGAYDQVIIGLPATDTAGLHVAVQRLSAFSTELLVCTDLNQSLLPVKGTKILGKTRLDVINSIPEWDRPRGLKMVLDIVMATGALVALMPLFLVVALAIKLESPGPVFFRQRRYGQNGRIFRIFKFRTMTVTEDGDLVTQAKKVDTRVTRVGRILRRTSIDELPQCLNVLLGDMSIVGPRPHALAHDQAFERQHELFALRRRMRPGITGWAQITGFRGELKTPEDLQGRMDADLYYVSNWSIWLDLEIIARTCVSLHHGAY